MNLFPQAPLNPGVRKREVFGWAMYDFANSGYTTVVLTAVFGAYFVGMVAEGTAWGTLLWTAAISVASLIVMLTMSAIGAYADLLAVKKRLLAFSTLGCVLALGIGLAYVTAAQARTEPATTFVPMVMLITAAMTALAALATGPAMFWLAAMIAGLCMGPANRPAGPWWGCSGRPTDGPSSSNCGASPPTSRW